MPHSRLATGPALIVFTLLACLIGWVFIFAKAAGADIDPGLLPLGPGVAALIVSAILGRAHLKAWGRRLITLRAAPGWYVVAILAPVAILVLAVIVNAAFGAPLPTRDQLAGWTALLPVFVSILIFIGIGEEIGWTAFAAPLLAGHSLVRAWLVLAAMRTVWHIPLMLQGDLDLVHGLAGNFAFQFLVLWLFRRTEVWLLAGLWHATLNTVGGQWLFRMVSGADQERLGLLMVSGYVILALVVGLRERVLRTDPPTGAAGPALTRA